MLPWCACDKNSWFSIMTNEWNRMNEWKEGRKEGFTLAEDTGYLKHVEWWLHWRFIYSKGELAMTCPQPDMFLWKLTVARCRDSLAHNAKTHQLGDVCNHMTSSTSRHLRKQHHHRSACLSKKENMQCQPLNLRESCNYPTLTKNLGTSHHGNSIHLWPNCAAQTHMHPNQTRWIFRWVAATIPHTPVPCSWINFIAKLHTRFAANDFFKLVPWAPQAREQLKTGSKVMTHDSGIQSCSRINST